MPSDRVAGEDPSPQPSAAPQTSTAIALRTRRLEISALTASDVDAFVAYRRDPAVARYQSWDTGYSAADAHGLVSDQASGTLPAAGRWLQLGLRDAATGVLVGDVGLHAVADQPNTYELGVTLDPAHQGRGLATEALEQVIHFLFAGARAHRVTATCDARNRAAADLLARVGMRHEAHLVDADWFKSQWTTIDTFAALARSWQPPGATRQTSPAGSEREHPTTAADQGASRAGRG